MYYIDSLFPVIALRKKLKKNCQISIFLHYFRVETIKLIILP